MVDDFTAVFALVFAVVKLYPGGTLFCVVYWDGVGCFGVLVAFESTSIELIFFELEVGLGWLADA